MKHHIFFSDFEPYYPPRVRPCPQYIEMANEIYNAIKDTKLDLPNPQQILKDIAINVACYVEDKMSDIGLWKAFLSLYKKMYHRDMPFFQKKNVFIPYNDDDINKQDIQIILWLVFSKHLRDGLVNPKNESFSLLAAHIMLILYKYEEVEINEELHDYIYNEQTIADFFKAKFILEWLCNSAYLLQSPLYTDELEDVFDAFAQRKMDINMVHYQARSLMASQMEVGPLALHGREWLAEMYRNAGMVEACKTVKSWKFKPLEAYHIAKVNETEAVLQDPLNKKLKVKRDKDNESILKEGDYIHTLLVYTGKIWELNGITANINKEVYEDRVKRAKQLQISYEKTYPLLMQRTDNKRLAFFNKRQDLKQWLEKIYPEFDAKDLAKHIDGNNFVAFISKKAGVIISPNIVHAVKSDDNPFYKQCSATQLHDEVIRAVCDIHDTHAELLQYLLDNKMLVDGDMSSMQFTEKGHDTFQREIDFLARHYRRQYYHDHDY